MRWTDQEIWEAARSLGLDPFETEYHTVPAHVLYDVASRGMPGRYSHWSHGKAFWHEITRHEHGAGRIYELVINSNPSHAFLLDVNSDVINLMVKLHVLGHTDFFKNSRIFQETDRKMPDMSVLRADRVRQYEERYGVEAVEATLTALQTVQFYVDPDGYRAAPKEEALPGPAAYDDLLGLGRPAPEQKTREPERKHVLPCRDILAVLMAEAPMEDWQRDLAGIVRQDGLYFWPQLRTKTINEGWASFWHSRLMRRMDVTDGEFAEYAKVNAGVVCAHPGHMNPYWLGVQLLKDIERRFGQDRLFDVRRMETDASLVRNYLTKDLVEELGLVRYGPKYNHFEVTEDDWEQVRDGIANDFAGRLPEVVVADTNHDGNGGLLLVHNHDGRPLLEDDAVRVLEQLQTLWRRPVHLNTKHADGTSVRLSHDGKAPEIRVL